MSGESLQTSFWVMVVIQTIGSVDMPGRGPRKLPAPRQYIAILVTWLVLQFISSVSAGARRATAAIGWGLVLTGLVVGPFGKQVVNLFATVSSQFGNSPTNAAAQQAAGLQPSQTSSLTPNPPTGVTLTP